MSTTSFNENIFYSVLKEGILKLFAKYTEKHLPWNHFSVKNFEFCECFQSSYFSEQLETDAFEAPPPYFVLIFSRNAASAIHFDKVVIQFCFHFQNLN